MKRFIQSVLVCAAVLTAAAGPLRANLISIQNGDVAALAQDVVNDVAVGASDVVFLALDTDAMLLANAGFGSIARTDVTVSMQNGQAILDLVVNHQRAGVPFAFAGTAVNSLFFTALATVPYTASGFYQFGEPGASNGQINQLGAELVDITDPSNPTALFHSGHSSFGPSFEPLVLGEMSGEFSSVEGSLTGTLLAGHQYGFSANMSTQTFADDGGAVANGRLTLTIGEAQVGPPSAVPEPASLALFGMGSMGMAVGAARRRRRASQAA